MFDPLLALCARANGHQKQLAKLAQIVHNYEDWTSLPERAEAHGLAPLVYCHLQASEARIPVDTRRQLMGLYLRHRDANRIRNRSLAEILGEFESQGIPALVLKGAALANDVYPQPGLRPMRDMDLLVRPVDAPAAQQALARLGFKVDEKPPPYFSGHHHLPVAQRLEEGLLVTIEVHHRLMRYDVTGAEYDDLASAAVSFPVNARAFRTLGHEDMLCHIYRHSFTIQEPTRLIGVADYVSFVEKYLDQIDWGKLKRNCPQVWRALPAFHYLTPWSKDVIEQLELEIDDPPRGVGLDFKGWPKVPLASQLNKGIGRFLQDTLWPSEWWMQLYYGINRQMLRWWWYRLLHHPLHILGWVLKFLPDQAKRWGLR